MGTTPSPAAPEHRARAGRLLATLIERSGFGAGPNRLRCEQVRVVRGQTSELIAVATYRDVESGRRQAVSVPLHPEMEGWDQLSDAEVTALLARDAAAFLAGHHWQRLFGLLLCAAATLVGMGSVAAFAWRGPAALSLALAGVALVVVTRLVTAALSRGLDLEADRRGVALTGDPTSLASCYRRAAGAWEQARGRGGRLAGAWRRVAVGRAPLRQRLGRLDTPAGRG
jgi:hypothetical protein